MVKKTQYLVKMSVGFDVPIESDELEKVLKGVDTGAMVRLRSGMIRGDLVAGIVDYKEKSITSHFDERTGTTKKELEPISDIFLNTKLLE